jgi:hypothetical protein
VSPCFLVLLKVLSLVAFLVEDACVGDFVSLCLSLLDFMLSLLSSFSLDFTSPSKIDATIGLCLTLVVGRVYHMFWLSVENQVFGKLRKQLS